MTIYNRVFKKTIGTMAIQKGDSLPSIEALQESKPGNGVDIAKEIGSGDAVVIGVPAAFSMSSSFYLNCCPFDIGFVRGQSGIESDCMG